MADSNYKEKKDSVAYDKVNLILEEFSTASYGSNIREFWFSKAYDVQRVFVGATWYKFVVNVLKASTKGLELPEPPVGVIEAHLDLVTRLTQHDDYRFPDRSIRPKLVSRACTRFASFQESVRSGGLRAKAWCFTIPKVLLVHWLLRVETL